MTSQPQTTDTGQLTSAVIAVVLRVAGAVITDVRPHAIGTSQQQVTARIGDALLYLTDLCTVARIRQQWDAARYIAVKRLPNTVSQTWLGWRVRCRSRAGGWLAARRPERQRTCASEWTGSCGRSATSRRGRRSAMPGSTPSATSSGDREPLVWTTNGVVHTSGPSLGIARRPREPAGMVSLNEHRWTITSIGDTTVYQGDVAPTRPQAWLAALAAGRSALLSGDLTSLAVRVDGQLEALLDPGRDAAGAVDVAAVSAELLEMYQSATADEVLERLVEMPGIGCRW